MDAMASPRIGARASPGPRANRISPCCLSIAIKRLRYRARARQGVLDGGSQKLTLSGKIAARIFAEERQKEAARQAAIEAALAKPPPPRVTKENWNDWHRRGWIVCPAKRQRTCSDVVCGLGARCKRMAELGLAGDGSPLRRKERPRCGARTRKGPTCLVRVEPGKRRCRFHGGLSTGPRTPEGKARIAAAQRRRWAEWCET
jgi:hypothetical protein